MPIPMSANSINRKVRSGISNRARLNVGSALGGASAALLALTFSISPAQAADECGAPVAGIVTCAPGGNPYEDGVFYDAGVDDLTVVLEDGVEVETIVSTGVELKSSGDISLTQGAGSITTTDINANGVSIFGAGSAAATATLTNVSTQADGATGVRIVSNGSDIDLTITGKVVTLGGSTGPTSNATGVDLEGLSGLVTANIANVSTQGANARGITIRSGDLDLTVTGIVSTAGADAVGVNARSYNAMTAVIDTVSTTGDNARGINLYSAGALDLTVTGSVTTTGQDANGITITGTSSANGPVTADVAQVSTSGDRSHGIDIDSSGSIDLTAGTVETAGLNSMGIKLNSSGDEVTAVIENVSTTGNFSRGIDVHAETGIDLTVTGEVTTLGETSVGIGLYTGDGPVTANIAHVSTQGPSSTGIVIDANGSADLTIGSVSTAGNLSAGMLITADDDLDLTVTGNVETSGSGSRGVQALSFDGNINATLADITTTGDNSNGINLYANNGAVTVTVDSVSTAGDRANGVVIDADQDIMLTVTGAVNTTGDDSYAVNLHSDGSVTAAFASVSTEGDNGVGIHIGAAQDITLTVTGAVTTAGDRSEAVDLHSDGSATATLASVTTEGDYADGISISAGQDITLTVTGAVTTAGYSSDAVDLYSGGSVTATLARVATEGDYADGIVITADQDIALTVTGAVTTTGYESGGVVLDSDNGSVTAMIGDVSTLGDNARGINVFAEYGAVTAEIGRVSTAGIDAGAIRLEGELDVNATVLGNVSTTGAGSHGLHLYSSSGAVTASAVNVSTGGNDAKGVFINAQDAQIVVAGAVSTLGDGSIGIDVLSNGPASVEVNQVSTSGDNAAGISILAESGLTSVTADQVTTAGENSRGVVIENHDGSISLTVNEVTTAGDNSIGVSLAAGADVDLTVLNSISTMGDDATAIMVETSGSANISVANVTTDGDQSHGISVRSGDDAAITVTVSGSVHASGGASTAVFVASNGIANVNVAEASATYAGVVVHSDGNAQLQLGNISADQESAVAAISHSNVTITTTGDISSTSVEAIFLEVAEVATLHIGAGSTITGATSAIVGGGEDGTVINNAGIINAGSAATIVSLDGPVTLNNSGTLHGSVLFGGADDVVNNSGLFQALGTSDFGGGADRFVNSGTLAVTGNAELIGLASFENDGVIALDNGATGDVLSISGDYVGDDGQLVMDIDFSEGTADQFIIGGAATGNTTIVFRPNAEPLALGNAIVLVEAGAGSDADAFTADVVESGLYRYGLSFDGANNDYLLAIGLNDPAFRTLKINEGAQSLWYKTADVVSSHLANGRHGLGHDMSSGSRIWGQLHGAYDKRGQSISYSDGLGTRDISLDYRQDYFGGQLGVDLGASGSDVGFGLTGGYVSSVLKLVGTAERAEYDAFNMGVYGGFNSSDFFINVLAKYDIYKVRVRHVMNGQSASFDGKSYGAQLEAGFRLGSDSFFIEPAASLAWLRTDMDQLEVVGATIDFDKLDGLRGKLGLRIGSSNPQAGGSINWYLAGHAVKEFEGRDGVTFSDGVNRVHLANQRIGTYGQADIGVNIQSANGVTGFFEGNAKFGEDYRGYGGRVGLRVAF